MQLAFDGIHRAQMHFYVSQNPDFARCYSYRQVTNWSISFFLFLPCSRIKIFDAQLDDTSPWLARGLSHVSLTKSTEYSVVNSLVYQSR